MTEEQEAELRYEAGMYQSLYEVATARIATLEEMMRLVIEDLGWSERDRTRTQLRAALDQSSPPEAST